jgi:hypothetical protein
MAMFLEKYAPKLKERDNGFDPSKSTDESQAI